MQHDYEYVSGEDTKEKNSMLTNTALHIFGRMIDKYDDLSYELQAEAAFQAAKDFINVKERILKQKKND